MKVPLPGATAGDTSVAIKMTRSMATALLSGLMAASTSVNGARASSMAKECTSKKAKSGKVFGKWAKESSGSNLQLRLAMNLSDCELVFNLKIPY